MIWQSIPVPPHHDLVLDQVTASAIAVAVIQFAKKSQIPWLSWINTNSDKTNRVIAALAAAISALALHLTWTWNPANWGLAFSGTLSLAGLFQWGGHWIRAFVWQEILYRGAVKNDVAASIAAAVKQAIQQVQQKPAEQSAAAPDVPASATAVKG